MFTKYLPQTQNYTFFQDLMKLYWNLAMCLFRHKACLNKYKEKWYNSFHPVWALWIIDEYLQNRRILKALYNWIKINTQHI